MKSFHFSNRPKSIFESLLQLCILVTWHNLHIHGKTYYTIFIYTSCQYHDFETRSVFWNFEAKLPRIQWFDLLGCSLVILGTTQPAGCNFKKVFFVQIATQYHLSYLSLIKYSLDAQIMTGHLDTDSVELSQIISISAFHNKTHLPFLMGLAKQTAHSP